MILCRKDTFSSGLHRLEFISVVPVGVDCLPYRVNRPMRLTQRRKQQGMAAGR